MHRYVLPLEIIGLLLTAALIGAVIVAMHAEETARRTANELRSTGYLLLSALLFAIGLAGALTRRNAILVLIGIELMLNAANLNFIAFWRYGPHPEALTGMMFAIFSIAVAAAEAAVGLALIISIYRHCQHHRPRPDELDEGMNRMIARTDRVAAHSYELNRCVDRSNDLWLIPALPMLSPPASIALAARSAQPQRRESRRSPSARMAISFLLSLSRIRACRSRTWPRSAVARSSTSPGSSSATRPAASAGCSIR